MTYTLGLPANFPIDNTPNFSEIREVEKQKAPSVPYRFEQQRATLSEIPFSEEEGKEPSLSNQGQKHETPSSASLSEESTSKESVVVSNDSVINRELQQEVEEPTEVYLKIQRKPILKNIHSLAENFSLTIGTRDSVTFYSSLKNSLNDLWKYLALDEPLALGVIALESALRYNKWNELDQQQANTILKVIHVISKETSTREVIEPTIASLQKSGINMFPYGEVE